MVSFVFLIYHAVTFFVAAPRAMVVHIGRRRLPEQLVLAGHYLAWAAASALVCWLLLGD
jgi:fumarate reductase subunit C